MDNKDWITLLSIFGASVVTTIYELVSKNGNLILERSPVMIKLLGAVLVSFFIMPGIMEYFELSLRVALFVTVVITYGLDSFLRVALKRLINTIEKDGKVSNDI